jgi:hypothetical protein
MKIIISGVVACILSVPLFSQEDVNKRAKPIVEEGKRLYYSELASWYGTDALFAQTPDRSRVGGSLSYVDQALARCILYSNEDVPKVIASITFDSTYNVKTAQTDFSERKFTDNESELYTIRMLAMEQTSTDTLFKHYENTSLNLIPLISEGEKKVYVLTVSKATGIIAFGNDYLLTFDASNKIKERKKLHETFIPLEYQERSDSTDEIISSHKHSPGTSELITATDICTLMLYEKSTNWNGHQVLSENYLSFWNCEKDELFILGKETRNLRRQDQQKEKK